jgi:nitrite reductase/ring-hydroxylating ferredoxin subunit
LEGQYIQCATHGALFRFEDGLCLAGPCPGKHLQSVPLNLVGDKIYITDPGQILSHS